MSSTEPSLSKTQSSQGLKIPESIMLFSSCIKETGLWRALVLGAAYPTVLRSLVTTLCANLLKTGSQGMPQSWDFGLHKSCQEIWQCFTGTFHFCKIYRFWQNKQTNKQNSFSDFYKGCLGGNLPVSSTHMAGLMITVSSLNLAFLQLSKHLVCKTASHKLLSVS